MNPEDARAVSGDYITSRRSQTTILSVGTVLGELKVSQNSDGSISADAFKELNGQPKKFHPLGPLLFQNRQSLLGFKRDASGRLVMCIDFPFMVFQKASWSETSGFNLTVIIGALCVFALTLLLWPMAALVRRHYHRKLDLNSGDRRWRMLVRIVCALNLTFVLGFAAAIGGGLSDPAKLNRGLDPILHLIQLIGWLGVVGTFPAIFNFLRAWGDRTRWWWTKLHDSGIALACVAFSWFVLHWNLLHWSLNY